MKKFMDLFFENEEENILEINEDNEKLKHIVKENVLDDLKEKEIKNEIVKTSRINHSKSFGIIDIEELQVRKPNNKIVKKEIREYETQPPISPIFGIIENDKKNDKKYIPPLIKQQKKLHTSHLGTVLSPIYGMERPIIVEEDPYYDMKDDLNQIYEEPKFEFENQSLEDLLKDYDNRNNIDEEISLFDEIINEDKD